MTGTVSRPQGGGGAGARAKAVARPQGQVIRLSPKQESSIANATSRLVIWSGAVRSGKTIASLLRWLMYVAAAPRRTGHLVIAGKTADTIARNVMDPLMDPTLTGPVARRIFYNRGAPTCNILGRRVEIISANDTRAEARLRGMTCSGAYVDEATLLPESFWDQLLARCSTPGAQIFATCNPDSPTHWLRKRFILRQHELDLRYFHFELTDNPALDPTYVENLKREYTGLWYRRFIRGEWVMAEGAIYDTWDPDRHVVDELPPMQKWLGVGIDYGTSNPFNALLAGVSVPDAQDQRRIYFTNEWRWDSREQRRQLTDAEYSKALGEWLRRIPNAYGPGTSGVAPDWMVVDPSAASFITQLHRDGFAPVMADNKVLDGIRTVASLISADLLRVHRSCAGWLGEIGGYGWDDKKVERGEDAPVKLDDHALDAGRYLLRTTQAAWQPMLEPVTDGYS
ncbi:PBSX family phage terminase large subunit [Spongiactinospora sp. TRM90649]|uniref:PBSX family phage terminase large subunit n=1 Tax=Spongiactinospora sp. TRM90649 TaxID=3031114 RepID=UPI0023F996BC|nr:PBSX family phage terminase large subunit [Spongiactinospora sp. TRM90649]MDF5756641.1 PBSX family phage terminase large subunit [Spongiactinospora sp. TRM90649]